MKPVWTVRPIAPLCPLVLVPVELGEVPVEVDEETEELKGVVVPVMLNCWDWARMPTPVGFCWIKLIWKPLPVGQPLAGPSTVVEPLEVVTSCFKTTLMFGVDTMLTKAMVKLEGSLETVLQETVWLLVLADQEVPWAGLVTVRAKVEATKRRAAEMAEKARIVLAVRGGGRRRRATSLGRVPLQNSAVD